MFLGIGLVFFFLILKMSVFSLRTSVFLIRTSVFSFRTSVLVIGQVV